MSEYSLGQIDPRLLAEQRTYAQAELHGIMHALWEVAGYNQDPIAVVMDAFPAATRRRSDNPFKCPPEVEPELRERTSLLGPGRPHAETLAHLNVPRVDGEVVETGQLHKTVTATRQALMSGQSAALMIFASDRVIPRWKKQDGEVLEGQLDAERLSTTRLLTIGGKGLGITEGAQFFRRAARFDMGVESGGVNIEELAHELPEGLTEFDVTERFLRTLVDEGTETEEVLPVGYSVVNGEIIRSQTGQVRRLGSVNGRDVILVHKLLEKTGPTPKDTTTPTMLLMSDLVSVIAGSPNVTVSYYSSATYKPSRLIAAIKAGLVAATTPHNSRYRRIVVPTYGYVDLSAVKGEDNPQPPKIADIAGEINKAAAGADGLRAFLATL